MTILHLKKPRETAYLWTSAWVLLVLAAYRFVSQYGPLEQFFSRHTDVPVALIITDALFFWLLALLWVAYRQWKAAIFRQRELERIINTISPDVIMVVNPRRVVELCNDSIRAMFGYEPEEVIGQRTEMLYRDRRVEGQPNELYRYLEQVGFHIGFATGRRINGVEFPIEIITGNIKDQSGVVVLIRDVSDRKHAEDALRESEERFALFMRHLPACAYIKHACGRIDYANRHFSRLFRLEESVAGKRDDEIMSPPMLEKMRHGDDDALRGGKVVQNVEEVELEDGTHIYETFKFPLTREHGEPLLGAICLDITQRRQAEEERRRLEEQMLQGQKLESLGLLGGGIAHDFNNLLAGILGYTDLALAELPEGASARQYVASAVETAKRAAELCNQLLAYSGQSRFTVSTHDLSDLVREMEHLLTVSVSKKARLVWELAAALPPVECDATQVRQVLLNLVLNASEALEGESGTITVGAARAPLREDELRLTYLGEDLPAGDYVRLSVSDTGCGMKEATVSKIFDPFFTTKFEGRGLGLAAVMGIVRSHRGAVRVTTAEGRGTRFDILLPAAEGVAQRAAPMTETGDRWRGSGCVLVVDDEDVVRHVADRMLRRLGFEVVSVDRGREALQVLEQRADIRAVLLDMTMPGLSGMEIYAQMAEQGYDLPVVFTSGYNKTDEIARLGGSVGFLRKPFLMDDMRTVFRKALAGCAAGGEAPA